MLFEQRLHDYELSKNKMIPVIRTQMHELAHTHAQTRTTARIHTHRLGRARRADKSIHTHERSHSAYTRTHMHELADTGIHMH